MLYDLFPLSLEALGARQKRASSVTHARLRPPLSPSRRYEFLSSQETVNIVGAALDPTTPATASAPPSAETACASLIEKAALLWRREEGDYRDDITAMVVRLSPFELLRREEEAHAKLAKERRAVRGSRVLFDSCRARQSFDGGDAGIYDDDLAEEPKFEELSAKDACGDTARAGRSPTGKWKLDSISTRGRGTMETNMPDDDLVRAWTRLDGEDRFDEQQRPQGETEDDFLNQLDRGCGFWVLFCGGEDVKDQALARRDAPQELGRGNVHTAALYFAARTDGGAEPARRGEMVVTDTERGTEPRPSQGTGFGSQASRRRASRRRGPSGQPIARAAPRLAARERGAAISPSLGDTPPEWDFFAVG